MDAEKPYEYAKKLNLFQMKKVILCFFFCLSYYYIFGQARSFYLQIPDEANAPAITLLKSSGFLKIVTGNTEVDNVLSKYQVSKFEKAFPTAVTPFLQEIYIVKCSDLELMQELHSKFPSKYPLVEEIMEPVLTYKPNDFGLHGPFGQGQNNLDLIRIPEAWDLTKGNEQVVIGVTDTDFDLNHPELENQIISIRGSNTFYGYSHGTRVAGLLSAETNNGIGISGTGYKCKISASSNWGDDNEVLLLAQSGIRVVNCSWYNSCSYQSVQHALYEEIKNVNNCIVVFGAGNGPNHCGSLEAYVYPASYDNVVSVTAVGHVFDIGYVHPTYGNIFWKGCHESLVGDPTSAYHHNDLVNICAPAYAVPTLKHTIEEGDGYTDAHGTSFAAPQVAATCALMISANPCLTADEVLDFLYSTADASIYDLSCNSDYIGKLGSGRLDAYEAVNAAIEAGRVINTNSIHSGTQTVSAPTILSAAGKVTSGSDITFQAPREVELRAGFEVELGAEFEIVMDYTCPFSN